MKKALSTIISISLISVLFLAGCGKDDTAKGTNTSQDESAGTESAAPGTMNREDVVGDIVFTAWGSDEELEVDQEVVDAFMEEYPNVNVTFEPINDDYVTKVETMMLAGNAPDVIYGHPKYFQKWASQDLLLDMTPYFENNQQFFDEDIYAVNLFDSFAYEDKYVSTINGADTFLLFYNQDLFDEAGVPYPTEDWTWDDFLAACEKLTIDKDGDGEIDQYAISTGTGHDKIQTYMSAYGGYIYDDVNNPSEVVINSEENKAALQMWYDLIFEYGYAPDAEGSEVVTGGFDGGQIAMDIDGVYS